MEHAADRAPHQLSMGERRRVAIAGVLAMDPQLLVLDEPSANLDPRARRELLDLLGGAGPHAARRHPRPPVRGRAVRARGDPRRGGRIVADGACTAMLEDAALLARHDLELPAGFDPALVRRQAAAEYASDKRRRRSRRAAAADATGCGGCRPPAVPHRR